MAWGDDIIKQLIGRPFYEEARKHNKALDKAMAAAAGCKASINKYHAKPVVIDGTRFASQAEGERWVYLKLQEKAGLITDLKRQVLIHFESGVTWRIDFTYKEAGITVYEDVKGHLTTDYRIKRELLVWELRAGRRQGIYREVKKAGRQWKIKEYGRSCNNED